METTPAIYGKAVLNSCFLRGDRFCCSNRSVRGLRKARVKASYKTKVSSAKSAELYYDSRKQRCYALTHALQTWEA